MADQFALLDSYDGDTTDPFSSLDSYEEPPKPSLASDVGRLALQGVSNVGGAVGYGLEKSGIAPEFGRKLQESDTANTQRLQKNLSPEQQAANAQPFVNPNYKPNTPEGSSYINPEFGLRSVIGNVVPSIPGTLAMGVLGSPLASAATKGLSLAGVGAKTAQTVGSGLGFGASEGAFSGAQNAAQWGAEQRAKPITEFFNSPEFQQSLAELGDPEQAKEAVINKGQSNIFNETLVKTGGISAVTGGGAFGVLRGAKPSDSVINATLKGIGAEAGQEAPQSYYEQIATNKATQQYVDPTQDPYEGAVNAAAIGGIAGGVLGSVGGAGPLVRAASRKFNDTTGQGTEATGTQTISVQPGNEVLNAGQAAASEQVNEQKLADTLVRNEITENPKAKPKQVIENATNQLNNLNYETQSEDQSIGRIGDGAEGRAGPDGPETGTGNLAQAGIQGAAQRSPDVSETGQLVAGTDAGTDQRNERKSSAIRRRIDALNQVDKQGQPIIKDEAARKTLDNNIKVLSALKSEDPEKINQAILNAEKREQKRKITLPEIADEDKIAEETQRLGTEGQRVLAGNEIKGQPVEVADERRDGQILSDEVRSGNKSRGNDSRNKSDTDQDVSRNGEPILSENVLPEQRQDLADNIEATDVNREAPIDREAEGTAREVREGIRGPGTDGRLERTPEPGSRRDLSQPTGQIDEKQDANERNADEETGKGQEKSLLTEQFDSLSSEGLPLRKVEGNTYVDHYGEEVQDDYAVQAKPEEIKQSIDRLINEQRSERLDKGILLGTGIFSERNDDRDTTGAKPGTGIEGLRRVPNETSRKEGSLEGSLGSVGKNVNEQSIDRLTNERDRSPENTKNQSAKLGPDQTEAGTGPERLSDDGAVLRLEQPDKKISSEQENQDQAELEQTATPRAEGLPSSAASERADVQNGGLSQTKVDSFETAKGSVYTVLPDGRTQRYKTATNEQNQPQDLTVFAKFKDLSQEQDFLVGIQDRERSGTKVYLIDKEGNKYDTNEQIKDKDVKLALVNTKTNQVISLADTKKEPTIGYHTFDQRRYKDDQGVSYREAHIGNKVTKINVATQEPKTDQATQSQAQDPNQLAERTALPVEQAQAEPAKEAKRIDEEPYLREANLPSLGYTTAKKQSDGQYKLFYTGTRNEVFPNEKFKNPQEAKSYLKVQTFKQNQRRDTGTVDPIESDKSEIVKEAKPFVAKSGLSEFSPKTADTLLKTLPGYEKKPLENGKVQLVSKSISLNEQQVKIRNKSVPVSQASKSILDEYGIKANVTPDKDGTVKITLPSKHATQSLTTLTRELRKSGNDILTGATENELFIYAKQREQNAESKSIDGKVQLVEKLSEEKTPDNLQNTQDLGVNGELSGKNETVKLDQKPDVIINQRTNEPFKTRSEELKALSSKTAYTEATPKTHAIEPAPNGIGFVLASKEQTVKAQEQPIEREKVNISSIDTPLQSNLATLKIAKTNAYKDIKRLQDKLKSTPLGGGRQAVQLEIIKAKDKHSQIIQSESNIKKQIEKRANELGQTTLKPQEQQIEQANQQTETAPQREAAAAQTGTVNEIRTQGEPVSSEGITQTSNEKNDEIESQNNEKTIQPNGLQSQILTKPKKQYLLDQKRTWLKEHKNATPQVKEAALKSFETNYETELDKASASIPFDQYKALPENKGQPEGVLRQAHEQLQKEYAQKTPESSVDDVTKKGEKVDKKFSQNTPTTGTTKAELTSWLDAKDKKLLQSGKLNIAQKLSDVPKGLISIDANGIEGFYDPKIKSVWIIADNVTKDTWRSVANHEYLHAAIAENPKLKERLLGAQSELNDILKQTESGKYTGRYKDLYNAALKRVDRAKTSPQDRFEEFLAYVVSEWSKAPQSLPEKLAKAIQNLVAAIKAAIFRYTGQIAKISPADLSALARSSMNSQVNLDSSNTVVMASKQGYKGNDTGEAKEWLRAKAKGLDMSENARMERAKAMGFDVNTRYYHGTNQDINEFSDKKHRSILNNKYQGDGFHFTKSPVVASDYAESQRNQFFDKDKFIATVENKFPKSVSDYAKAVIENGYFPTWNKMIEKYGDYTPEYLAHIKKLESDAKSIGSDLDTISDLLEYVEGSNYNKGKPENNNGGFFNIFGGINELPEWVYDDALKLGIDDALPKFNVIPVMLKLGKTLKTRNNNAAKEALSKGYDSVIYSGENTVHGEQETIVYKPNQIRSIHAAFDPDYADSPNLLASRNVKQNTDNGKAVTDNGKAVEQQEYDATRAKYFGTKDWMKAPNGKPTNLNEVQWVQTRTPAFKKWFGDFINDPENSSKVVDENGEPLVVYSGSRDAESIVKEGFKNGKSKGIYFTPSIGYANIYAKPAPLEDRVIENKRLGREDNYGIDSAVFPVFLSIKNPFIISKLELSAFLSDTSINTHKENGNDGIIHGYNYDNKKKYGKSWLANEIIVFNANQIKSATGNTGAFSPESNGIRYSIRDDVRSLLEDKKTIIGDSQRSYEDDQREAFRVIGREITEESILTRLKEMRKDLGKRWIQGTFDQFSPIKEITEKGYMLSRLSKGSTGAFEVFMRYGKLKIDSQGAYNADTTGGVINNVFSPIGKETHDFLYWVAANRAEQLMAEERENLFTKDHIKSLKRLNQGETDFNYTLPNGTKTKNRSLIYNDTLKKFNEFNKNALDMAEQSGLIDGESRQLWEKEFYVPFYRVMDEEEGGARGFNIKQGIIRQEAFKKLKGGEQKLNSDLLENTLMNWAHLIDASAKNRAAKETLEAAERLGAARKALPGEKNTVWFKDNGSKQEYKVDDPYLLTAISALEYAGIKGGVMDVMSSFKHMLTIGVTASPFYKVRNLIRDSVHSVAVANMSYNIPKNVKLGWDLTARENQEFISALAGGGMIRFGTMLEGSESKRTQQLIKLGNKEASILNNENKVRAFYDTKLEPLISAYNEIGNRGEEINRISLYDQLIKQGKSHLEASFEARDMMDFSSQGTFIALRILTQVVPFMNSRLQGIYRLGKAYNQDKMRLGTVIGVASLASLALLAAYSDDDDWKKREDWDRDNYWWFKFGGEAFRIPKPFEIGVVTTLAERTAELIFDKEMTGDLYRQRLGALLGSQLSLNPIPQVAKPIIDLYANKDSFTGRPIESMSMERLEPSYRYRSNTSLISRGLSTTGNQLTGDRFLSPVQIDHLIRAYFSWLGGFVVGGADMAVRSASDEPTKPSLDMFKFITGNMVANTKGAPSKYVSRMYDQAKVLEQAYGTYRQLIKEGKIQEAQEFRSERHDDLIKYKQVSRVKNRESKINEKIRAIERSTLTPQIKKQRIDDLKEQQDRIAREIQ